MEKRAILAVVLSIAVFYGFSFLTEPKKPDNAPNTATQKAATAPASPAAPQSPPATNVQTAVPASPATQKEVVVETDLFKAVFTTRGAALKSVTLKKYREADNPNSNPVVLGADSDPAALNFSTTATGFNLPEGAIFTVDADTVRIDDGNQRQLIFTFISGQGFTVRKTYTLSGNNYGIGLETQVLNNSPAPLVGAIQQVMTYHAEPKTADTRFETAGSYLFADGLKYDKAKDVSGGSHRYDKDIKWAGFSDKYFLMAAISEAGSISSVEVRKNQRGFLESRISSPQVTVNPGQAASIKQRLFIGPKDLDILKAQGNSLEQSLDLGWFAAIAKPLLYTLKFFHRYVGNYGVAIIIITIILKVLFFPLTHKSYKSMKDMQKLQPKMTELKEKHKNDRDALNKAVMELYRDNKVNPMGGCLPMVVQIPVFFALYKALMFSIELRHAPFMLWIHDLADKDPYYVTPIIMGVTMFVQQKMTPSQMDPIQQKMMLVLPVVFTFMFLSFPSGLVLYWLVNNILTIGQQMYINKLVKD